MKKILAVSGGVDSMLLLWRFRNDKDAVVAHFNHGTRPSADADAELVRKKVAEYGLEFFYKKVELGEGVSEAEARKARYDFLSDVLEQVNARADTTSEVKIFTAHHLNDLAETIAINLLRGTGWRGLAPFSDARVERPFITEKMTKNDILVEAAKNGIVFRQDPTNVEENYLRNRLRKNVAEMGKDELLKIYDLYEKQTRIRQKAETIIDSVVAEIPTQYPRGFFQSLDDDVALEILRGVVAKYGISLTRPQLKDFLTAVREYLPGKKFNLPGDRMVEIRKNWFSL